MITELLVAAGAAYVGAKTYKRFVDKKNLAEALTSSPPPADRQLLPTIKMTLQRLRQSKSKEEKKVDRDIIISLGAFAVAVSGKLFFYPLGWISVLGTIYVERRIYKNNYHLLREGKVGVDTLAFVFSIGCIASQYFVFLTFTDFFYLLAYKFMVMVKKDSSLILMDALKQDIRFVWILVDGVEIKESFAALKIGDIVVVHAGEMIPVDGTIREGIATIDERVLTGGIEPIAKGVNDEVFASTIVLSGRICINVEKAGAETTIAKIGQVLEQTVEFKSTVQLRAENLADKTALPTLLLSGIAAPFLGPSGALGIITAHFMYQIGAIAPLSVLNHMIIASQNGILIKDGRTLDLLNQVDTIIFDKTGTLTEEHLYVGEVYALTSYTVDDVLMYAAIAEYKQTHPIARAIIEAANNHKLTIPTIAANEYKVGHGLTVKHKDQIIRVGSRQFMTMMDIPILPEIETYETLSHQYGHSLVMVALDETLIGAIELCPTIRPEAKAVINQLRQQANIQTIHIISGDQEIPTQKLAQMLGVDHYFAEMLPESKADIVGRLKNEGRFICYIGDGINDAIAMKQSHVTISLRGAATIATDTAQVILLDQGLKQLDFLFALAQDFHSNLNTGFGIILTPTILGIGGIFLSRLGVVYAFSLKVVGLGVGIGNSMYPLLKSTADQSQ